MSRGESRFEIGGVEVPRGQRASVKLPVARLFTGDWLSLPVTVVRGAAPGPSLWLDAAIHGDELNGLEIIRRLLGILDASQLEGTVIAVPVVNVFGFVHQDRYLPDRRDLNRSFPGSARGSLAARLAHLFMEEVVRRCSYGVDFHTGSNHRSNLPQIRAHLEDSETRRLAEIFGAPLLYHARPLHGSLRTAARQRGAHILVYEAGEPLRFHEDAIEMGVQGTLRVLGALGMWLQPTEPPAAGSFEAASSSWVRASRSGIFHLRVKLGDRVRGRSRLGTISDPWSTVSRDVRAPFAGLVMGFTNNPMVHQGDALVHLAREIPRRSF